MAHLVKDWMSSPVIVIDHDTSVSYAIQLMRKRNIHSLIITSSSKPSEYGIVTSTDIRDKVIALNRNPAEVSVGEIMTAPIMTARPDWTLIECSRLMQQNNFNHIPVSNDSGEIIGMISTNDLFSAAEEAGWED